MVFYLFIYFFRANILLNQVFKYSKEHPENKGHSQQKFKESMLETEYYISNYENKCGTFQYFKKKTPLDVGIAKKPHRKVIYFYCSHLYFSVL